VGRKSLFASTVLISTPLKYVLDIYGCEWGNFLFVPEKPIVEKKLRVIFQGWPLEKTHLKKPGFFKVGFLGFFKRNLEKTENFGFFLDF